MSNLQAVLTSAAMAAPKKGEFHLVSDYRAVNKKIEKVSGITPIQEVEMADLRSKTRKLDMLQGYLADVVGGRSPVHVHHRHPRRSVSPHACTSTRFERNGLLPRCEDRPLDRVELQGLA